MTNRGISKLSGGVLPDASTSQKGLVQLNSSSTATDDTTAATPGMVQGAIDAATATTSYTDVTVNTSNTIFVDSYRNQISYTRYGKIVVVVGYDVVPAVSGEGSANTVLASGLPVPLRSDNTFMASTNEGYSCRFGINSIGDLVIWWSAATVGGLYNFSTVYIAKE